MWYQRSTDDHDTHYAASVQRGQVHTLCGIQFAAQGHQRLLVANAADPVKLCPTCKAAR